ncbi:MAG TPA: hypothetical protein VKS25_14835 [Solirubrobacteraceae bacterium]|nr:hypothetical protein [Solirubrobacteraceae bacterium]
MRRRRTLALLNVAALLALFGTVAAGQAVPMASGLPPGAFTVQPKVADPACNGGRGVSLNVPGADNAVVSSATMGDGSTLLAFSNVYPGSRSVLLRSITPACEANRELGNDGAATITIPSGLLPARHGGGPGFPERGVWINTIEPRGGGGAIIAGAYGGNWTVGELTSSGTVDQTFGTHGWVVMPFRGEVTAILPEPSGRIVVAGDNGGGGCCTVNWAAALSKRGLIEKGFGTGGRAPLPTGEDSGVQSLELEPNGDILADIDYGHMGCYGVAPAMLTPSGAAEPTFAARLRRFWGALGFNTFVGDLYVAGRGFTLVGTGQKPCAENLSLSAPSATGLIARFRIDGQPAGPTIRFSSRLQVGGEVLLEGHDAIVATGPLSNPLALTLTALRPDGTTDTSFGSRGHVQISTTLHGTLSITEAIAPEIVAIAAGYGRNQVQLIRVRL